VSTESTFTAILAAMSADAGRRDSIVLGDATVGFSAAALIDAVDRVQKALRPFLVPGTVICSMLPSGAAFVVAQAAVVGLGGSFIGVPADSQHYLDIALSATDPDWLLVGDCDAGGLGDPPGAVGVLQLDLRSMSVVILRPLSRPPAARASFRAALGVVTSGSTGTPKVVAMSEDTYCHAAVMLREVLDLRAEDRLLHALPVQRGAGWMCWAGLAAGTANRVERVRSGDLADALRDWDATGTFTVSTALHALVLADEDRSTLPRMRTIYYSSGPLTHSLKQGLAGRFGERLVQDYGMTEVPEPLTVLTRADHARGESKALASVGRPLVPGRVAITGDDGDEERALVKVRSPWMLSGYWREGDLQAPQLDDGWLVTGDLGSFDADGYLCLNGRTSATVRSGGIAFRLDEVLDLVRAAPGVIDARVSVVDDDHLGERLEADVVLAPGTIHDCDYLRAQLKEISCDARMVPTRITLARILDTDLRHQKEDE
jgi:acyl-CoA synthetase (AMP-forming)/AMP-acid ligase II